MNEEIKRNCNSCRLSWMDGCETLREELDLDAVKTGAPKKWDWKAEHKIKSNLVCDKYKSMYIEYPIEVSKINSNVKKDVYKDNRVGKFVKISPCGDEYENKTYLGLYLGNLPVGNSISHSSETKELDISFMTNPAIFIFDLKKIVYGMESWWGIIEKEEDLKEITDKDIGNVWYMKVLKELFSNEEEESN